MDFTLQMENIFKFFSLSLNGEHLDLIIKLKKKFMGDLNLFGCFIKDFLTIENKNKIPKDENLYNDFVVYYEKNLLNLDDFLKRLESYSDYFISIVFETAENKEILGCIETINACFMIEAYPCIMQIMYAYYNKSIDDKTLNKMLKSLTDIVLTRLEDETQYNINLFEELEGERLAS